MAVIGDTLSHCTGTGTEVDPYIFNTAEGFAEVISVEQCYAEAGQSNLSFDCNDGVITAPIIISCSYLDGKGLTILNALINQTNAPIIKLGGGDYAREIKNLNVYNFCDICYSVTSGQINMSLLSAPDFEVYDRETPNVASFYNCNFAGIFIGITTNFGYPIVGKYVGNSDRRIVQFSFSDCTFNFHFKDPTNSSGIIRLFAGSNKCPVLLKNCSVSLSGNVPNQTIEMCGDDLRYYSYAKFDTVTISNSPTNPLTCNIARFIMPQWGYNYYKLYLTTANASNDALTISDPLGLINRSRLHTNGGEPVGLAGIVMQEDDPSASDYIYNQQNLTNAGFLTGQVIE